MKVPSPKSRRRALLWMVPLAGVLIAALAVGLVLVTSKSSPAALPSATPSGVLNNLRSQAVDGYSGTLVANTSLGLPAAKADDNRGAHAAVEIGNGSYSLRYWYGGRERERVALLGAQSEADYFRSGSQAWQWDSVAKIANKGSVPAGDGGNDFAIPTSFTTLTPQQLADRAVASIDGKTGVTLGAPREIAGRDCYALILTPDPDQGSRIGSVRIYVDGETSVPLAVQIYPFGSGTAAVDVSFSAISFKVPSDKYFTFEPPADATVSQTGTQIGASPVLGPRVKTYGSGWTAVAEYKARASDFGKAEGATVTPVSGGTLIQSPLLTILAMNPPNQADNSPQPVYVGSVEPSVLLDLAGH